MKLYYPGNRKFKYGACYVLFNEEDYIRYSLASIYDWADIIYILLGEPFENVEHKKDSTEELVLNFPDPDNKINIYYTSEKDESVAKNILLKECEKDGLDYCWIVEGDEVYDIRNINYLFENLDTHEKAFDTAFLCGMEYWRSLHHVIGPLPHYTMFIADSSKPIRIRSPGYGADSIVFDKNIVFYHHYGLARKPSRIRLKYSSTKAREMIDRPIDIDKWMKEKYLAWKTDRDVDNLYPFQDDVWGKTKELPKYLFPEIMKTHKWYGVDCIEDDK